jgi:ATP:ADP antiporter, AAA family
MSPVSRLLRIVTVVRPPEIAKALLLTVESFLLILGHYQAKAAREGLLLAAHAASIKAYLAIPQVLLLVLGVKAFAWLAGRVPRHLLITWVSPFAILNLLAFVMVDRVGVSVVVLGIAFFVWLGVFNLAIPAQFWGIASDLYTEDKGRRLVPLIGLGASLGGDAGPLVARQLIPRLDCYGMMLVTAGILVLSILLTWVIHGRDIRDHRDWAPLAAAGRRASAQPGRGIPAGLFQSLSGAGRCHGAALQHHQRTRGVHDSPACSARWWC